MAAHLIDITGQTFGTKYVIGLSDRRHIDSRGRSYPFWRVRCLLCGTENDLLREAAIAAGQTMRCCKKVGKAERNTICRYNDGVDCGAIDQSKCEKCGWYKSGVQYGNTQEG